MVIYWGIDAFTPREKRPTDVATVVRSTAECRSVRPAHGAHADVYRWTFEREEERQHTHTPRRKWVVYKKDNALRPHGSIGCREPEDFHARPHRKCFVAEVIPQRWRRTEALFKMELAAALKYFVLFWTLWIAWR